MELTDSVYVVACSSVERSLRFYQDALQFIILNQRIHNNRLEWVHLQSGRVRMMLERSGEMQTNQQRAGTRLYFYTDDVAAFRHYLAVKGYSPTTVRQTAFMKEFDLLDPDSTRITVGQNHRN